MKHIYRPGDLFRSYNLGLSAIHVRHRQYLNECRTTAGPTITRKLGFDFSEAVAAFELFSKSLAAFRW